MEKLLNEYKDKITKFDVYDGHVVIHLEGNGVVEIESADEMTDVKCSHITNS